MAIFMLIVWHSHECISTQCALQLLSNSTHLVWGLGSTAPCASKIMSFAFRAEETMTFWINKRTGNLAQGSGHHRKPKRTGKQKIQEYRYPRSSVWLTTTLHRERQSPLITAKKDIFKSTGDYNFHKFFVFFSPQLTRQPVGNFGNFMPDKSQKRLVRAQNWFSRPHIQWDICDVWSRGEVFHSRGGLYIVHYTESYELITTT